MENFSFLFLPGPLRDRMIIHIKVQTMNKLELLNIRLSKDFCSARHLTLDWHYITIDLQCDEYLKFPFEFTADFYKKYTRIIK